MKIKHIKIWKENLELTRPYTIAYETFSHVENLFVVLETETGITGIGAGSPAEDVTGESIEASEKALDETARAVLEGREVVLAPALLRELEARLTGFPAALAALDIALHDLVGKLAGKPLATILGQVHTAMPTSITMGIKPLKEALEEADEYIGRGFTRLKVKTGIDVDADIELVCKLREHAGSDVFIRVDANQGYTPDQYLKFWKGTHNQGLELVEQPLAKDRTCDMLPLPEEIRESAMADECLQVPADAIALLPAPRPFGLFNIKLMKCGGIAPGLEIARMAQHAGIGLMWGCMDESIVSITAALHAAFASPATQYLDLDGSLDLAKDMVKGGFILENGVLRLTDQPGLGVSMI